MPRPAPSSIKRGNLPLTACAHCHRERGKKHVAHCEHCFWWRCPSCRWINSHLGAIAGGTS